MRKDLEAYIDALNSAPSRESAFETFCNAMQEYGYDKVSYTLCTDHPSLGLPKQHGLSTSYPDDWMTEYRKKNLLKIDPVVKQLIRNRKPFFWDSITNQEEKGSAPYKLMKNAEDAGVADGIGISFITPYREITGIGIARRSRSFEKKDYSQLAEIHFLTVYFHETYRELSVNQSDIVLSDREKEILCWSAEGKLDDEIAFIMNISFNTVRYHWKNIFNKLSVFSKIHAVTKALRLNLILPGNITY